MVRTMPQEAVSFTALPGLNFITHMDIGEKDARVEIVKQFFARYNSPLEPFAPEIVAAADLYDLDFRLLPAIAMQESNLCLKAPKDSHNCWGYGIYGKRVQRFTSYPEAIQTVTKTLATKYKQSGLNTPDEIVKLYTPTDDGKWTFSVKHFMAQLQ